MIIEEYEGVTISILTMNFIVENTLITEPAVIDYVNKVREYYEQFYYGVKLLGGKLAVEKLQLNYRARGLPRVNKYLDNPPTVVQSDADKINRILNFEQEFNRTSGHALELEIRQNNQLTNKINFYNFGLNNNELDLVTPYLTVNSVDIPSLTDVLEFKLYKPINYTPSSFMDYFSIFGSFIFRGRVSVEGMK